MPNFGQFSLDFGIYIPQLAEIHPYQAGKKELFVSIVLVLVLKYTAAYWGSNLHLIIKACLAVGISGIMTALLRLLFIQRTVDDVDRS